MLFQSMVSRLGFRGKFALIALEGTASSARILEGLSGALRQSIQRFRLPGVVALP